MDENRKDVIFHRSTIPAYPGYVPESATEYRLPALAMPSAERARIHPWLAQFVGMSPEHAHQVLERRWAGVSPGPLLKVRELLLGFGCTSLVVSEQHGWLGTERSPDDCDLFLIAEPIATDGIDRLLNHHGLSGNKLFRDFLVQFGGLREHSIIAGSFVRR